MGQNENQQSTNHMVPMEVLLNERAQYEHIIKVLLQENANLKNELESLRLQIEELKRQLGQHLKNSHFPPSRDIHRPPVPNHRKKGGGF